MAQITAPEPLTASHDTSAFDSDTPELDEWLKRRALQQNTTSGAPARTYVVTDGGVRVVGYYALATGAVEQLALPKRARFDMPTMVPAVVLARLAVHRDYQRTYGLGTALLKDALQRALAASQQIGASVVLVDAISEAAKQWYLQRGFKPCSVGEMQLMIRIKDIEHERRGR